MSGCPSVKIFNCLCETVLDEICDLTITQICKFYEKAAYCLDWYCLALTLGLNKLDEELLVAK